MEGAEEVKSHLDIVDIVGEYLPLRPAGTASFKTNCPFHQEKTPSFFVNRQRQSWHCFGCDKGGDMISFVMDMEGMDFRDTLEFLAQKAGVVLPAFNTQASSQRKRLIEINELASKFFRAQLLQSPQAEHARAYAEKRAIDNITGDLFKIGYAPNSWDSLLEALKEKDVQEEEMVLAGLLGKRQDGSGYYDRFRDRLMFSIQDIHGNVVGFTGRILNTDAKEAKYVNTPETAIYKKSMVLYGLDKAKGEIKKEDLCVIVEGNMDVLSSHRENVTNVVASSGTALTAEQLKLIKRFTSNIAISFDGDSAGINATLRGLDLARAEDFSIRVITLDEKLGKDPDEVIAKNPDDWRRAIKEAREIMDWIFALAFKDRDLTSPQEKKEIAAIILPEIKRIADPIVRDHWIKKLAESLSVSEQALRDALTKTRSSLSNQREAQYQAPPQAQLEDSKPQPNRDAELLEHLFCFIVRFPGLIKAIPTSAISAFSDEYASLYKIIQERYSSDQSPEANCPEKLFLNLEPNIERLVNYLDTRADREELHKNSDLRASEFTQYLQAYLKIIKQKQKVQLEEQMRLAELSGDKEKIADLEKQFLELNR